MNYASGAAAARKVPAGLLAALIVISALRLHNYLLFHAFAELFSVVIAATYAVISWHTRRHAEGARVSFLGVAYFFVAVLDTVHTLSFHGMGVFVGYDYSANQVWVVARFVEAVSLCVFSFVDTRTPRPFSLALLGLFAISAGGLVAIYGLRVFPACYVPGSGQTVFKVAAELCVMALLALASVLLRSHRGLYSAPVYRMLQLSIWATVASEIAFTVYVTNSDALNLTGHLLKIVSFYLVYRAIVVTCLVRPQELLYSELASTAEALRLSNEAKDQFISILSHDLRGPLSGIRSYAALYAEKEGRIAKRDAQTAFTEISKAADLALRLVERVLDWAKSMSGASEPDLHPVDLGDAVSLEFDALADAAARKRVVLRVLRDQMLDRPPIAVADDGMLATIIRNLVQNAIKFTPPGGSVSVSFGRSGGTAILAVTDTGVGISPELLGRLFDSGAKLTTPGTDGEKGSGFGLVLCAEFARKMGGSLSAESEAGRGSAFRLALPAAV